MLESNVQIGDNVDLGRQEKAYEQRISRDKTELSQTQKYAEDINLQVDKWVKMPSSPTKRQRNSTKNPRYMTETASTALRKT